MEKNSNIEMITGDPKKAINKLSLPIIASMFLIFANIIKYILKTIFFNIFSPTF